MDLKFKLEADSSNFDQAIDKSMGEIRKMGKQMGASTKDIKRAFAELGKQGVQIGGKDALKKFQKEVEDSVKVVKDLEKEFENQKKAEGFDANSVAAQKMKDEIAIAKTELAQLQAAYTAAQKEAEAFSVTVDGVVYSGQNANAVYKQMKRDLDTMSASGKNGTEQFIHLSEAAGKLLDSTQDTHTALNKIASDTAKLDAAMGGMQAAAGAYSVLSGAMEAFGMSSDTAEEAQKKLQSAIAITTGLQSVANQFQKQSSVMQGILAIQEKARAKANTMLAAAQGKATMAQRLFNAVAKANPYVLLASALVTVVGALAAFTIGSKKTAAAQKDIAAKINARIAAENTGLEIQKRRDKILTDEAQHAKNLADAEGKSKREILELEKKQLELEQQLWDEHNKIHLGGNSADQQWITDYEDNVSRLEAAQKKLDQAVAAKDLGKTFDEYGVKPTDEYIAKLTALRDAIQQDVERGAEAIENRRKLAETTARLAEETRQLAIAEDQANTAAKRTTQDLQTGLMDDKYEQQKKQTEDNYNRQIEDIKTRLANEKNLTETERTELNKQMVLLEQTRDKELERMQREHLNEKVQAEADAKDKIISIQNELADEQTSTMQSEFDKLVRERKQRLQELTDQEESWIKEQGGLIDAEGHYTDTSKLTEQQKEYLKQAREAIDKMYGDGVETWGTKLENTIFESYATGLQKALREQDRLVAEKAFLQSKGRDTTEVNRQIGENALAYMQSEEQEINPRFQMWIEDLVQFTAVELEGMLESAEAKLALLEKDPNTDPAKLMEARAELAAYRKEKKAAEKDISRAPQIKRYEEFNKTLEQGAEAFAILGQTGNEAFDSLMKNMSEVMSSAQNVVESIISYTIESLKAEEMASKESAEAVKSVEKASVILAVIGAVLQIVMKIKEGLKDTNELGKMKAEVEKLRDSLRDLKREMALDTTKNNSIFGENVYKDLQQYTKATSDYADEYQKSLDKMAMAGLESQRARQHDNVQGGLFGWGGKKEHQSIDEFYDSVEAHMKQRNYGLNEAVQKMLNDTVIVTQEKGLFKREKVASLAEILGDVQIIGETEEETIKNLKKLVDEDPTGKLKDEQKSDINNMIADWETYQEALEGVKDTYRDFFGDMTNSFADAIKTGFEEGAGAGKAAFSKSVNEMVSDFVLKMRIGERLADKQEEYSQKLLDAKGDREKEMNIALAYADELKRMQDEEMDYYKDLQSALEARGYGLKDAMDGTLSGAIKGASQESIDLLSGYCNAVRIQQIDGQNIMRDQLISLSGIERNTGNISLALTAFRNDFNRSLTAGSGRDQGVSAA